MITITRTGIVHACLAALCGWSAPVLAQGDRGSLTDEFKGLSAKERSRIAEREVKEAASDQAYQQVMAEGEAHFQAGRYEEALATFQRARAMRPYNVYPKVKIQDLEALLGARAAPEAAVVPTATPPPATAPPMGDQQAAPRPAAPPPATGSAPVQVAPTEPGPPEWIAAGGEERRYKEGNAFVIERTVREEGATVVYKRVQHPWGQVYHFRDGLAVDERVWRTRFHEP